MVPLDDGRRKRERLAVSRNYQLIIYVYAAVGAEGLLTPFAMDGVPRAEYITTHSYASARVSRAAPKGVGEEWGSAPCSYYTSLKSCHPLRHAVEIYSRFHTLLGGLIVPVENRENEFYGPSRTVSKGREPRTRGTWPRAAPSLDRKVGSCVQRRSTFCDCCGRESANWLDNGVASCLILHQTARSLRISLSAERTIAMSDGIKNFGGDFRKNNF